MEDRLWSSLQESGCSCVPLIRKFYATPWHVACAVDDADDCAILIGQATEGLDQSDLEREGELLWTWISGQTDMLKRLQLKILSKARKVEAFVRDTPAASDVYSQQVSGSIELQKKVSRSQIRWLSGNTGSPAEAEKVAKKFWGMVLVQIMLEAKLPICDVPADTEEQRANFAFRALGVRRSKTLRNRARCWKKARQWFQNVKNVVFPKIAGDVLDYLVFLEQEVGTKTCIDEFMAALSVLEDAGQVPTPAQLSKDRLVVSASKSYMADLKEGRTSHKQAPPLTVSMLVALEIFVCAQENPTYGRCLAWACLICVWACMRVSDLQGIDVNRLFLYASGLKGVLTEVPFFIRRDANLSGQDWLDVGLKLWFSFGYRTRTYLV